jgi:hypothetical protein
MTHDLYAGTDADAVLSNPTLDTIAMLFQSVVRNDFPARAGAMARVAKARKSGSHMTRRWREMDSNFRFRVLCKGGLGR